MGCVDYRRKAGTTTGVAIETHPGPADAFRLEVPATADRLVDVRHRLLAWLEPIGISETAAADIVLVVNEACSNSVEHAYRDVDTGLILVEANREGGRIVVCIADQGVWRSPPDEPSTRGRGLPIMEAMSDGVQLDTSRTGTTVRMTFDLADAAGRFQGCGSRTT
jgi:anti-sigma regulatory factor (Ser/Thr protein kinase)